MILVTGTPRSGSSAVMQTLSLLGVPIAGSDTTDMRGVSFLPDDTPNKNCLLKHNTKGFWTLPEEKIVDLILHEDLKNQAIKILAPLHGCILNTHVQAAIVCCRRSKTDQARSMHRLINTELSVLTEGYRKMHLQYLSMIGLEKWLEYYQGEVEHLLMVLNIPILKIYFEDLIANPDLWVREINTFLNYMGANVERAINNLKGELSEAGI